jgi:non-ribosomal peptide synthetase component F
MSSVNPDSFATRKAQLSAAKQALLEKRLRGEGRLSQAARIPRRSPQDPTPLSFAQERLWFFRILEPESLAYNASFNLKVLGSLNVVAFEQSLNALIQRHEILRTTYRLDRPEQIIHPWNCNDREQLGAFPAAVLTIVNLQSCNKAEQKSAIHHWQQETAQRPFDFSQWPLLRVTLLQLAAAEHLVLVTMHHILTDGWSIGVFTRELFHLYQTYSQGQPGSFSDLPIQYADYALWQRRHVQGELLQHHLDYWQQQLAGSPPLLALPTDFPRSTLPANPGQVHPFTLSATLIQSLRQLSQQQGTTLFMTLLAAFAVLLYRYSGQEDILIGSPVANRDRPETQSLLGCFVNTLVLRARLYGNPPFREFLAQVRDMALEAYAHQAAPFEQVVEVLRPQRSLSYTPLFQVMFVLQNAPLPPLQLPGLSLEPLPIEISATLFDLTLTLEETPDQLTGLWEYNSSLFQPDTIVRLTGHFQTLLEAIVTDVAQPVGELPLLTPEERHQMLVGWNNTERIYPQPLCYPDRFAAQVQRSPEAIAVAWEDQQLTYAQLDRQATKLARRLQTLGVQPEVLVGLCSSRSIGLAIGVLSILKAGGVYVPLDPTYPPERLRYLLQDSGIALLLTERSTPHGLNLETLQSPVIYLDIYLDNSSPLESKPQTDSEFRIPNSEFKQTLQASHLAYVIYTSGSTGQPKGVMIEHRGLLNHLYGMIEALDLQATDTIAQTAPIGFDISIWQILTPWLVGGKVQILPTTVVADPLQLLAYLQHHPISVLQIVPSLFKMLLEPIAIAPPNLPSLRWLLITGEAFPLPLQEQWFQHYPHIPLVNAYGPAECSDDVTLHKCISPEPLVRTSHQDISPGYLQSQLKIQTV